MGCGVRKPAYREEAPIPREEEQSGEGPSPGRGPALHRQPGARSGRGSQCHPWAKVLAGDKHIFVSPGGHPVCSVNQSTALWSLGLGRRAGTEAVLGGVS